MQEKNTVVDYFVRNLREKVAKTVTPRHVWLDFLRAKFFVSIPMGVDMDGYLIKSCQKILSWFDGKYIITKRYCFRKFFFFTSAINADIFLMRICHFLFSNFHFFSLVYLTLRNKNIGIVSFIQYEKDFHKKIFDLLNLYNFPKFSTNDWV